jgi:hypothetical protein
MHGISMMSPNEIPIEVNEMRRDTDRMNAHMPARTVVISRILALVRNLELNVVVFIDEKYIEVKVR